MKLRFEVDQAACFREGIDCPKSIVTIEVDPSKISQAERDWIADRMNGIDVCHKGHMQSRIRTQTPDYAGLLVAIKQDEDKPLASIPTEKKS